MPPVTLEQLRRFAISRSLFEPTSLRRALNRLGFIQADPIRAPARAQDLCLRVRVRDYRAGDLERLYPKLGIEEDFFVNYGFVTHRYYALMHPRPASSSWDAKTRRRARELLRFVQERGRVHPNEVDAHFDHGRVRNYWGGTSNATTHLLDAMQYRGLLRIAGRDRGVRVYAANQLQPRVRDPALRDARLDALVDLAVHCYAPLPAASLGPLLRRVRFAAPQWRDQLNAALGRAKQRLAQARIEGGDWYWPQRERATLTRDAIDERLYLLAPFDPLVWDRRRFELFWGWAYRFEAYTPPAKRKLGYYALPMLWLDRVIGWANLSFSAGQLDCQLGFIHGRPQESAFERELEAELARMRTFLG